jgi:hypothetical protein
MHQKCLFNRLEATGIDDILIPGFARSLANSFMIDPKMSVSQVKNHLRYLGWDHFELDYHTWQLAVGYFELSGIRDIIYLQPGLFIEN